MKICDMKSVELFTSCDTLYYMPKKGSFIIHFSADQVFGDEEEHGTVRRLTMDYLVCLNPLTFPTECTPIFINYVSALKFA